MAVQAKVKRHTLLTQKWLSIHNPITILGHRLLRATVIGRIKMITTGSLEYYQYQILITGEVS